MTLGENDHSPCLCLFEAHEGMTITGYESGTCLPFSQYFWSLTSCYSSNSALFTRIMSMQVTILSLMT